MKGYTIEPCPYCGDSCSLYEPEGGAHLAYVECDICAYRSTRARDCEPKGVSLEHSVILAHNSLCHSVELGVAARRSILGVSA